MTYPQILSFGAQPDRVSKGAEVTLSWETVHAERCTLTPGSASGQEVQPSGSLVVIPEESTMYVLEAFGEGSAITAEVEVTVEVDGASAGT